jgi:hypothetical protein
MKNIIALYFLVLPVSLFAQSSPSSTGTTKPEKTPVRSVAQTASGTNQSPSTNNSASPAPGLATPISAERKQKLETLWKAYEGRMHTGADSLKQYMNDPECAKRNPNMGQFINPKVQEKAIEELGKVFMNLCSDLSDAEVVYLTQLYSTPIMKKFVDQVELKLWNKDTPSIVFRKTSKAAALGELNLSSGPSETASKPAPFGLQSSPVAPKTPKPPPKS